MREDGYVEMTMRDCSFFAYIFVLFGYFSDIFALISSTLMSSRDPTERDRLHSVAKREPAKKKSQSQRSTKTRCR